MVLRTLTKIEFLRTKVFFIKVLLQAENWQKKQRLIMKIRKIEIWKHRL